MYSGTGVHKTCITLCYVTYVYMYMYIHVHLHVHVHAQAHWLTHVWLPRVAAPLCAPESATKPTVCQTWWVHILMFVRFLGALRNTTYTDDFLRCRRFSHAPPSSLKKTSAAASECSHLMTHIWRMRRVICFSSCTCTLRLTDLAVFQFQCSIYSCTYTPLHVQAAYVSITWRRCELLVRCKWTPPVEPF